MPFELTEHPGYFRIRCYGAVTPEDLVEAARQVVDIERAHPEGIDRLTDFREVEEFRVQYLFVSDFAKKRRESRMARAVKSAIVADRPVATGFANMYRTILNHPEVEVRVFPTEAEALAWLREPAPGPGPA